MQSNINDPRKTVAFESRILRALLLQILDF
jgi:hypothetical protein